MQIASRQIVWNEGGRGTVVEVEMTPATGLYLRFLVRALNQDGFAVSWGDGSKVEVPVYEDLPVRPFPVVCIW